MSERTEIRNEAGTIRMPMSPTERVTAKHDGESKTDQSQGNETNINNIVARFTRTGIMPGDGREGQFADVTGLQRDLATLITESRATLDELELMDSERARAEQAKNAEQLEELQNRVRELESPQPSSPPLEPTPVQPEA